VFCRLGDLDGTDKMLERRRRKDTGAAELEAEELWGSMQSWWSTSLWLRHRCVAWGVLKALYVFVNHACTYSTYTT
jgi:hypothetical protein